MAKFVSDSAADAALDYVRTNAALIVICNGQPTSFAEAKTDKTTAAGTFALGESTLGSTFFTGPTNSTAAGAGRKIVSASIAGINIDVTSTGADHIAIVSTTTASLLLAVATIASPQDVTSGNTATVNSFTYQVQDVV